MSKSSESPSGAAPSGASRFLQRALKPLLARVGYCSKPAFMIIGAQKSGSSSLHKYLCRHPQVAPAVTKEIHFFDREVYAKGSHWYHSQFPLPLSLAPGAVTMDDTPRYIYHPEAASRIHAYNPDIKLVAVLRDPVERAYSGWNMFRNFATREQADLRELAESRDFETCLRADMELVGHQDAPLDPSYIRRGFYAEQLERYFQHFPREQIRVIDFESLKSDTADVLQDLVAFLGLERYDWESEGFGVHNVNPYESAMPEAARAMLSAFYKPYNEKLYALLGRDFAWQ